MPNWCYNKVKISFDDYNENQLRDALHEEKELFNQLVPRPKEYDEGEKWYWWNVENWGTKWDAQPRYILWGEGSVEFTIDTAWSPPIKFYAALEELGYFVEAYYQEEGMAFLGCYTDGYDDFYEYGNMDADEMEANLPSWVEDELGLISRARDEEGDREYEEWQTYLIELERTDWYPKKINPVREGSYEVKTKDWPFPQYCNWTGEKWQRWEGDDIKVHEWRGITEVENLRVELDKIQLFEDN